MITKRLTIFVLLLATVLLVPITIVGNQALDGTAEKKLAKWEWQDASLDAVFGHISTVSGVDIVVGPDVSGKVSMMLRNKSWQEVFKIICKVEELHYSIADDYIFVMTEKLYITKKVERSQSERNLESVEELQKIIVKLDNTTAEEMTRPVEGLLSDRGKVTVVPHTNSLIIDELSKNIDRIKVMIDSLDRGMHQISISTKIVEVSSGKQNDIGIQWSFFDDNTGAKVSHLPTAKKGEGIIQGPMEKVSYGILDQSGFSIAMDYLLTESQSEVVAEPQITTLENKEAHIFMGSRIPVSSLDYAGNTKITMIDAGTELTVTPRITGDGRVKMELNPVKKSYTIKDKESPIIHEQGAETEVIVRDGETVVIAGLSSDDDMHIESGIPFLKDIPILGFLFKKENNKKDKKDLVIFVTPHIVKTTALDIMMNDDKSSDSVHVPDQTSDEGSDFQVE